MVQQSPKMAQGGNKKGQNRPNMTPRWLQSYLEIIRKSRENLGFASEVHLEPKMAQNGTKLAPKWPQDAPQITQDGPKGLC